MALKENSNKYSKVHHIIRAKLYRGLRTGSMNITSLYKDERLKMVLPQTCYYCGSDSKLSVDHLIPKFKDGPDLADNLIWACKSCNSSKGKKDMLEWMEGKGEFPSILLLRRYLKIVIQFCQKNDLMGLPIAEALEFELPFAIKLLPHKYPKLAELKRWVTPINN